MNQLYKLVDYIFPVFLLLYIILLPTFFIISGISFRSTMQLQSIVALLSAILTVIFVSMKIIYYIQERNNYRLIATAIFFIFGAIFPAFVIIQNRNWIWQENFFVGLILASVVFIFYSYLGVSPAEWRRSGSIIKVRDATYRESLQAFGRDPLMVCFGIMFVCIIFYNVWRLSLDNQLFLNLLIDTILE